MKKNKRFLELFIFGRVQGVYFRKTIKRYAEKLGLYGSIENLADGSVHVIVYGHKNPLGNFLALCNRGSFFSQVKKIEKKYLDTYKKSFKKFTIIKKESFLIDQLKSFTHLKNECMNINKDKKLNIPKHVVIIPNGNRTWAKQRGLKSWEGYFETYKNMGDLTRKAQKLGIAHLTLWGFSTENWKRDSKEIEKLFELISLIIKKLKKILIKEKIRFNHFGRKDRLPKNLLALITELETTTKEFKNTSLNIALDYGGRDEIIRAVNTLLKSEKKEITENEFSNLLDTSMVPDPDLIIRTANEKRMSGMMPWQSTYAEYYFTDVYFPEFKAKNLNDAVIDFSKRKRTFGGDLDKNKK